MKPLAHPTQVAGRPIGLPAVKASINYRPEVITQVRVSSTITQVQVMSEETQQPQPDTPPPVPQAPDITPIAEKLRAQLKLRQSEGFKLVKLEYIGNANGQRYCCIMGAFQPAEAAEGGAIRGYYEPVSDALGISMMEAASIESGWMSDNIDRDSPFFKIGFDLAKEFNAQESAYAN